MPSEFVGGWLESRDIHAEQIISRGLPVTMAEVGPADAPTLVLHGHLDVVPGGERAVQAAASTATASTAAAPTT